MTPAEQAVIDAARAWAAGWGNEDPYCTLDDALFDAVAALDAASAPVEGNEARLYDTGLPGTTAAGDRLRFAPDEVNEAHHYGPHVHDGNSERYSGDEDQTCPICHPASAPDEVNEVDK